MKDSHGTYDGRRPEPPYPTFSEDEYRQLVSKLQSRNELLSEEIKWVNVLLSGKESDLASLRAELSRLRAEAEGMRKGLAALEKQTAYYFRANGLKCEISNVKDCGECAACRTMGDLKAARPLLRGSDKERK